MGHVSTSPSASLKGHKRGNVKICLILTFRKFSKVCKYPFFIIDYISRIGGSGKKPMCLCNEPQTIQKSFKHSAADWFIITMENMNSSDSHIWVIRAGFLPVALRLPAAVTINQLCQIGRFLGVSRDELVLQKLFGCRPLWRHCRRTDSRQVDIYHQSHSWV